MNISRNLSKAINKPAIDKMVLAQNVISTFDTNIMGLNNNSIILGATGSGKSMSVTEPQILNTFHNNLVVTMTKRKVVDEYALLMQSRGYKVEILDLTNPEKSTIGFDPLNYIHDETDVLPMARSVVYTSGKKTMGRDPYWDEAAITLIAAEMAALLESWEDAKERGTYDSPEPTLENLLELHRRLKFTEIERSGITVSTLDNLFERLERDNPISFAAQCWKSVKGVPYRTAACILSTVNVAYANVFTPKIREVAMRKPLDPIQLGTEKTVYFIITSPVDKSANMFANIVYSAIFKILFELAEASDNYRLPVPVHMICDDFACGSPIPDFAEYISVIRATGISASVLVQSESQFEKLYGEADAVTIMNNCDRMVYFGGNDIGTCNSIAKRANVPFDEVYNMPLEKVYVFERGKKAVYTNRYRTKEDPIWQMVHESGKYGEKEKA